MRDRAGVIIIEKNQVALIKRIRNNSVYYVFPGGGIEEGEDPETAAKREAFEELGVNVNVSECFSKVEFNGTQYFFLAEIVDGTFGTGQGEEYTRVNSDRGTYLPIRIDIENLSNLDVKPKEVAIKVQSIFNNSTN
ncbi:NUDIX hydrolase [Paenisporosarcina sp. NPDC076898]|uniref:NUDIX hydrolase n=1 Tax=unclassified Paenisporosarcina TaxID=2642018 RepID=UPI003D01FE49